MSVQIHTERLKAPVSFDELHALLGVILSERLAFVDFMTVFAGGLNRVDIMEQFGIGEAASSRVISQYKELRPDNLFYDRVERKNMILVKCFTPLISYESATAISMLSEGFSKGILMKEKLMDVTFISRPSQRLIEPLTLAELTRNIANKLVMHLNVISGGNSEKQVLLFGLVRSGDDWYFNGCSDYGAECIKLAKVGSIRTSFTNKLM